MTGSQIFLCVTLALSMFASGQVWLVQLSSYKLWNFVGIKEWPVYHEVWWRSIWGIVLIPAAILFIASIWMLWWRAPGVAEWKVISAAVLQVLLLIGTLLFWAPLMANLTSREENLFRKRYRLLLNSHWI